MFSPKIEIINYFDELINQVDIDIEESIKNYNENQVLGDLKCFKYSKQEIRFNKYLKIFESTEITNNEYRTEDLWSESTKVVDYLNQVRMRTIDELKKAQEESLEYYKLNSWRFNSYSEEINVDEKIEQFKSEFFREKLFYFQIRLLTNKKFEPLIFNLFTFVTNFYMSKSDINKLEMFIVNSLPEIACFFRKSNHAFDEKMISTRLLCEYFYANLTTQKYPNNLISVSNRDIQNIKEINSSFLAKSVKLNCLSKLERLTINNIGYLEEIELDGLSSLQYLFVSLNSVERFSARNLPSLKHLVLSILKLDKSMSKQLFENLSTVRELEINGVFSDFNLDDLVNLEILTISGEIEKGFNFDLFKILCYQLKELSINIKNISSAKLAKLFESHIFHHVTKLKISHLEINKLKKRIFDGFPILQFLTISNPFANPNRKIREIANDLFSDLTQLVYLDLSENRIEIIKQKQFSGLLNLETLNLTKNRIDSIEENAFSNLKNLVNLDLSYNSLSMLNPNSFIGLENLKILELSCNNFEYLDQSIFDFICNIKQIGLSFNPVINRDEILTFIKRKNEKKNGENNN